MSSGAALSVATARKLVQELHDLNRRHDEITAALRVSPDAAATAVAEWTHRHPDGLQMPDVHRLLPRMADLIEAQLRASLTRQIHITGSNLQFRCDDTKVYLDNWNVGVFVDGRPLLRARTTDDAQTLRDHHDLASYLELGHLLRFPQIHDLEAKIHNEDFDEDGDLEDALMFHVYEWSQRAVQMFTFRNIPDGYDLSPILSEPTPHLASGMVMAPP